MRKDSFSIIRRSFAYLTPYKVEFILAGLLLAASTVIGFVQPLVIQQITDNGMLAQNLHTLCQAVGVLALLVALNQMSEMAQTRLFINVHNKFNRYFIRYRGLKKHILRIKTTPKYSVACKWTCPRWLLSRIDIR